MPETFTVASDEEQGKEHYYLQYPCDGKEYGCRAIDKVLEDGRRVRVVDVKGKGGQVVAPGSIHPDTGKRYRIIKDLSIAAAPQWVLDLAVKEEAKPTSEGNGGTCKWDEDIDRLPISETTRNLITNPPRDPNRSEAVMSVVNALVWANLSDADIFSIFDNYPIGEKYREKGNGKAKWLQQHIEKARAYIVERADESPQWRVAPLDIFGGTSLAGEPELPLDALPQVIADFAKDEAERLGLTPSMVAMPALAVSAAAITDAYKIQPKQHDTRWKERACLWIADIA